MTALDKARLEAAAKAVGTFKGAALYNQIQSAITAYIAPLPAEPAPADVADMAERLNSVGRHLLAEAQHTTGRKAVEIAYARAETASEAASMLTRIAAEKDALINGETAVLPKTRKHAEDLYTVAVAGLKVHGVDPDARATAAEAALAEARRALEAASDAQTRLNNYADEANAGRVQADGRELKRKIWGAFADFRQTYVTPAQHEGEK